MVARQSCIQALNGESFEKFLTTNEFAVVDFSADWCPPCKAMEEAFLEVLPDYSARIAFGRVDVDSEEELAERFDVESVPYLVFFQHGREARKRTGFLGLEKLRNDLERLVDGTTQDLTHLFADGNLWKLDDDTADDILDDVGTAVLLFTGTNPSHAVSVTRKMVALAKKYEKRAFFAILDSRRCPRTRGAFAVSRAPVTLVFLHRQKVHSRIIGKASDNEYEAHIEHVLEESS